MIRALKNRRGEGYFDVAVLVLCAMLVIALAVQVFPAYIAKQQVDTFASELIREAEISGRVGTETDVQEQLLRERTALEPEVTWSKTGKIQLNEEVTITCRITMDIGFGGLGSFPVELMAQGIGKSEVYWK